MNQSVRQHLQSSAIEIADFGLAQERWTVSPKKTPPLRLQRRRQYKLLNFANMVA